MLRNTTNLEYAIPSEIRDEQKTSLSDAPPLGSENILDFLHRDIIGNDATFKGPFGVRKIGKHATQRTDIT